MSIEKWKQGEVRRNCLFTVEHGILVATFERTEDAARAMAAINEQTERYEKDQERLSDR